MSNQKPLWGIDLGGTKIEGVILKSKENPEVLIRERIPTEAEQGYEHIIDQIARLVEMLKTATQLQPEYLGVGTPGALDPLRQTMKNSNSTALNGQPLKKDLEEKLQLPIRMANDANCFAMAEAQMGIVPEKLPEAQVVFGVIMGTGVGGGIVVDGQVMHGRQGIAGEWGHIYLDESGGECYCGKIGCVERILSGPSLQRYYQSLSGQSLKLPDIMARHQSGTDAQATQTVERLLHYFGLGIAQVINILDPDAIVLGGGLGNIDLLYTRGVEEAAKHVFNPRLDTPFLRPKLGDSAGVFGAAFL